MSILTSHMDDKDPSTGPSATAFLGPIVRKQMASKAAETQTSTSTWDADTVLIGLTHCARQQCSSVGLRLCMIAQPHTIQQHHTVTHRRK